MGKGERGGGYGAARIRSADDESTVNVLAVFLETIELDRFVDPSAQGLYSFKFTSVSLSGYTLPAPHPPSCPPPPHPPPTPPHMTQLRKRACDMEPDALFVYRKNPISSSAPYIYMCVCVCVCVCVCECLTPHPSPLPVKLEKKERGKKDKRNPWPNFLDL